MTQERVLTHEFVEFIPEELKADVLYVSMPYATIAHKCCCGCGMEVVTPLSPTDWKLIFDGKTISLDPSIGNWSFPCQSHYWIKGSRVKWSSQWSQEEVTAGRARDSFNKGQYFKAHTAAPEIEPVPELEDSHKLETRPSLWTKFWKRLHF